MTRAKAALLATVAGQVESRGAMRPRGYSGGGCRCGKLSVYLCLVAACIGLMFVTALWLNASDQSPSPRNRAFQAELARRFPRNGSVVLALVDAAFTDMAVNLYETSLKPFGIKHYMFVGAAKTACERLLALNISCYTYVEDDAGGRASVYLSKDFLRKMNIRTDMILDALWAGFSVVHTDLDVVFLRNPMPELEVLSEDLALLWDDSAYNAGFLRVRATASARAVYERVRASTAKDPHLDDQNALNRAISWNQIAIFGKAAIVKLDIDRYQCGLRYFETTRRMFAGEAPCPKCVVVHNNWIVSKAAKVYRFKETGLWDVDLGGYYSSPTRRYLQFSNPTYFVDEKRTLEAERSALVSALALGALLDRTVLLPRLHCGKDGGLTCSWNSRFDIEALDSEFGDKYRENVFLQHRRVPASVWTSQGAVHVIVAPGSPSALSAPADAVRHAALSASGATQAEVVSWFGADPASVLRFSSLYKAFAGFSNMTLQAAWQAKVARALKPCDYRQLKKI